VVVMEVSPLAVAVVEIGPRTVVFLQVASVPVCFVEVNSVAATFTEVLSIAAGGSRKWKPQDRPFDLNEILGGSEGIRESRSRTLCGEE
jgi:hypothetical protein